MEQYLVRRGSQIRKMIIKRKSPAPEESPPRLPTIYHGKESGKCMRKNTCRSMRPDGDLPDNAGALDCGHRCPLRLTSRVAAVVSGNRMEPAELRRKERCLRSGRKRETLQDAANGERKGGGLS